jgi:hypothetical protein
MTLDLIIQIILIICLLVFIDYLSVIRKIKMIEERNIKVMEHFSIGGLLDDISNGISAGLNAMSTVSNFIVPSILKIFNFLGGMVDSATKYSG